MSRIDAIQYLVYNGCGGSEWQEAGMWMATRSVMNRIDSYFEENDQATIEAWLEELIEYARDN